MRMLDLFSGIGGISLAADWAGIETVAFCEIEPFPQKVLRKNWPGIPIFGDIKKLNYRRLMRKLYKQGVIDSHDHSIDIICGGYPCQPFSNAGKRQGQADDRHLWPEMFRLVRELRPTWVVGENVAGHISLGLDDVLADLESEGYQARAFVLPAAAVGAPHRRDRVFIVGYSKHNGYSSTAIRGSLNPSGHDYQERKEAASKPKGASQSGNCKTLAHTPNKGLQKRRQSRIATAGTEERTGMEPEFERCSESMAYSNKQHDDNGRCTASEIFRERQAQTILSGSKQSMADTDSKRKSQSEGPIQNFGRRVIDSSQDLAYTSGTGWEEQHTSSKSNRSGYSSGSINERGATRTTQSRMGGVLDGISDWLDGHKWPAGYGQEQYEWEPPRVATGVKDRVWRLKGLGNAVVPHQIYPIFAAIVTIWSQSR
ncbi:DNA cytosine methyltransferase [Aneurinibacillus aneurinilyticus]|nr:DNA cytosine methyltransferase [Aneurinibacillus aneurinilyticus]MED0704919.1 DNA cytosine methyltransferase [Aneurinibacillus aneurinilyticus]MED0724039.1 DNA cytosine methyltransferase [Aneurinibacillus aneurinilyticus]MED0731964.1 DNA cytosine methyltransferase [Aneurinibacillus aneurinilyticus]MED0741506.1 DNA cytosine methyltransferase [Aneurinibacillus aneurinilyticus]